MSKLTLLLCLTLAIGCSSGPSRSPAGFSSSGELTLRPIQELTLPNGLRVIFIPESTLPRVSLHAFFKVGSYHDAKGMSGLNSLTAHLADQGTTTRSASQIADDFGQLGTELELSVDSDFTEFEVSGLAHQKTELLKYFADVILNPTFQAKDLERERKQMVAGLLRKYDSPSTVASDQFSTMLFGDHPYGVGEEGRLAGLKTIKRQDVIRHYFKYYRPNNAILVVAGDIDEGFKTQVQVQFGAWEQRALEAQAPAPFLEPMSQKFLLVHKKDLAQSQIRIGHAGIQRTDPDFLKLRLANVILGGTFQSRLNSRIRIELGLTYGISSSLDSRKDRGAFTMTSFSRNDKASQTVQEAMAVFANYVEKGATEKELQDAKEYLKGQFPVALETVDSYAMNLCLLRLYGISDDYLKNFYRNVSNISLSEVNAAIKKHFDPKKLQVLVYSDKKQVLESLKKVGAFEVQDLKKE